MIPHADMRPARWSGWRCTACGERIDYMIKHNRIMQQSFVHCTAARRIAEQLFTPAP